MAEALNITGPSEVPDYYFRDTIRPPARSFVETIILQDDIEAKPNIAPAAETIVESMTELAADAYRHFGGGSGDQLPIGAQATYEDVLEYVADYDNHERFGVWGYHEEVAQLAHKYLIGEGEDYESFRRIGRI
jgi:hypothetical protein